jgi:LacI family transcriptional regulator
LGAKTQKKVVVVSAHFFVVKWDDLLSLRNRLHKAMKKNQATIYDIAQALDITPSTVSRALNGNTRISLRTRKAVQEMAKRLNYQQNHLAAALRHGRTNILGVIVPTINRGFFASIVRGIEQVANQAGFNVMIAQSGDDPAQERSNLEALLRAQVDGVAASISKNTLDFSHYQRLKDRGLPLILFDRVADRLGTSTVVLDDYLGAFMATEHLIQQGCRRIAHFAGRQNLNIYRDRRRGYQDALQQYGIPFAEELLLESDQSVESGQALAALLLALPQRPDAIFSASDWAAVGALQVLKARSVAVPRQVAVVGFADEPFTTFVDPPLSSINQRSEQMGQMTAQLFLEEVEPGNLLVLPRKTVLRPELVVRASSLRQNG